MNFTCRAISALGLASMLLFVGVVVSIADDDTDSRALQLNNADYLEMQGLVQEGLLSICQPDNGFSLVFQDFQG